MAAMHHGFLLLCFFAVPSHVDAGILSDLLDFSTTILSTGDVFSDGYMCYHFRETAEEEGVMPIFFMISASLLTFSSVCGVVLFLYNNWGGASKASPYHEVHRDQTQDDEPIGSDEEQQHASKGSNSCLGRWSLGEKVSNISWKCVGDERPMLQSVCLAFLTLLLVIVLVPVGQILPILLWLQARHSAEVMPEEPRFPLETMPREPQSRDLHSPEWQRYRIAYRAWIIADLYPYRVRSNQYFEAQLRHKINTQFPFVMETAVESTPQSLLQISALVIYSQRDAAKITVLQCASMFLSLVSIFSKAYIVCESLVKEVFVFKMLCALSDVAGLFFAIASLWTLRRGDDGAIDVFFLSRPVDLFAAIYVWSVFAFACILTAAILLVTTKFWLDGIAGTMVRGDSSWYPGDGFGRRVIRRLSERWPKHNDWETKAYMEDKDRHIRGGSRILPPCLFVFASLLVFQICILCVLCLLMLPALLGLQICRTFWIALCIQKQEAALSHADIAGPYSVKKTIIPSFNVQESGDFVSLDSVQYMSCYGQANLFATNTYYGVAVRSRQKPFPLVSEWYGNRNRFEELPIVAGAGNDDILMVDIHLDLVQAQGAQEYKSAQEQTRDSYVQAYAFVREGSDFEARLRAVLHALWTSHYDFVPDQVDPLSRCRDLASSVLTVLKTVPTFFQDLEISLPHEEGWDTFPPFRFAKWWTWTEYREAREDWTSAEFAYPCMSAFLYAMEPVMYCLLTISVAWFAMYAIFFPLLSFGLSTHYALTGNKCQAVQSAIDAYESGEWCWFNKNAIWDVIVHLHSEDCYEAAGTPLNWVRTVLFLVQAVLFASLLSTTPFLCWPFLRFALQVPRYIVYESPERFMQRVHSLYERLYEKRLEAE